MSALEKAKSLLINHNNLNDQLEVLKQQIRKEEKKISVEILKLVDQMNANEFDELFHCMKEDSNLKFNVFCRFKDRV